MSYDAWSIIIICVVCIAVFSIAIIGLNKELKDWHDDER